MVKIIVAVIEEKLIINKPVKPNKIDVVSASTLAPRMDMRAVNLLIVVEIEREPQKLPKIKAMLIKAIKLKSSGLKPKLLPIGADKIPDRKLIAPAKSEAKILNRVIGNLYDSGAMASLGSNCLLFM